MLSRLFAGSVAKSKPGPPTQRLFLNIALVSFLIALVLLVAILYTPWAWPRILLAVAVVCGALSVFAGLTSIVLGQRGGHA
jgi:glucan phosphoethanolaminetransferase (alkaline phosphatase superfamily)